MDAAMPSDEVTIYYFDIMQESYENDIDIIEDQGSTFSKSSIETKGSVVNFELINGLNMDSWRNYERSIFQKR